MLVLRSRARALKGMLKTVELNLQKETFWCVCMQSQSTAASVSNPLSHSQSKSEKQKEIAAQNLGNLDFPLSLASKQVC